MKRILFLLPLCCVAMISTNCKNDTKDPDPNPPIYGTEFSENLVQVYVEPATLEAQAAGDYINLPGSLVIALDFYGRGIKQHPENEEFKALSRKYGDTSYNKWIVPFTNASLLTEFSSVEVTCDRAIDSRHPAGASLADIVKLCATSPYRFIRSGYNDITKTPAFFLDHNFNIPNPGYEVVFNMLDRLTADDLKLLAPSCYLLFEQRPAPGEYTFTITFRDPDGDITTEHAVRIE